MAGANARARPRALVTRASSGTGQAFAEHFVTGGYDVVVVARRRERLEGARDKAKNRTWGGVDILAADLTTAKLREVERPVA
jgi:uncharacterized protein